MECVFTVVSMYIPIVSICMHLWTVLHMHVNMQLFTHILAWLEISTYQTESDVFPCNKYIHIDLFRSQHTRLLGFLVYILT